jgi:hypothetical protein
MRVLWLPVVAANERPIEHVGTRGHALYQAAATVPELAPTGAARFLGAGYSPCQ